MKAMMIERWMQKASKTILAQVTSYVTCQGFDQPIVEVFIPWKL